jgi:hypothetical protein
VAVTDDERLEDGADVGVYCRAVEAHLCRKNDGHLIRVSGPAFDLVRGWAQQGIPLKVVQAGIDRTFERYYAKAARRRPVHISFCEADVLDLFDDWRRALGVTTTEPAREMTSAAERSRESLRVHLDRVIGRLTAARSGAAGHKEFDESLERIVRELDAIRAGANGLRGHAREAALARLEAIDGELMTLARGRVPAQTQEELEREAVRQLAPFAERMPPAAYTAALEAAIVHLVREAAGLSIVRYER